MPPAADQTRPAMAISQCLGTAGFKRVRVIRCSDRGAG
jgi:hypothetical protein